MDHPECWERLLELARKGESHNGVICIRTNKKVQVGEDRKA